MESTSLRRIQILQQIPRDPGRVSTSEIRNRLEASGEEITVRTLQNDLEILSGMFPIQSELIGRSNHWYWRAEAEMVDIPGMTAQTALALFMAEQHLSSLLPPDAMMALEHHFNKAKEVLRGRSAEKQSRWIDKVITIPSGIKRYPPEVDSEITDLVYTALMEEKAILIQYWKPDLEEEKEYLVSPVGVIQRDQTVYLVGFIKSYTNHPNIFAMHRIEGVEVVDKPYNCPKEFSLEYFVNQEGGNFQYRLSDKKFTLELLMEYGPSISLEESPLSLDQEVVEYREEEECTHFKMTVEDTMQLRAWLRSYGDQVEIISPSWFKLELES